MFGHIKEVPVLGRGDRVRIRRSRGGRSGGRREAGSGSRRAGRVLAAAAAPGETPEDPEHDERRDHAQPDVPLPVVLGRGRQLRTAWPLLRRVRRPRLLLVPVGLLPHLRVLRRLLAELAGLLRELLRLRGELVRHGVSCLWARLKDVRRDEVVVRYELMRTK